MLEVVTSAKMWKCFDYAYKTLNGKFTAKD